MSFPIFITLSSNEWNVPQRFMVWQITTWRGRKTDGGSMVSTTDGAIHHVKESPEEIEQLIGKARLKS